MRKQILIIVICMFTIGFSSCNRSRLSSQDLLTERDITILQQCQGRAPNEIILPLNFPESMVRDANAIGLNSIHLPYKRMILEKEYDIYYSFLNGCFDSVRYSSPILQAIDPTEYIHSLITVLVKEYGDPITYDGLNPRLTTYIGTFVAGSYSYGDVWSIGENLICEVIVTIPSQSRNGFIDINYRQTSQLYNITP